MSPSLLRAPPPQSTGPRAALPGSLPRPSQRGPPFLACGRVRQASLPPPVLPCPPLALPGSRLSQPPDSCRTLPCLVPYADPKPLPRLGYSLQEHPLPMAGVPQGNSGVHGGVGAYEAGGKERAYGITGGRGLETGARGLETGAGGGGAKSRPTAGPAAVTERSAPAVPAKAPGQREQLPHFAVPGPSVDGATCPRQPGNPDPSHLHGHAQRPQEQRLATRRGPLGHRHADT